MGRAPPVKDLCFGAYIFIVSIKHYEVILEIFFFIVTFIPSVSPVYQVWTMDPLLRTSHIKQKLLLLLALVISH